MFPWRRIKADAVEGFRTLREEAQAIFNRTLVGTECAKMRRTLYKVEEALQEKYQEVGEEICRHFTGGEDRQMEKSFVKWFAEIERLQIERQRILDEMKNVNRMLD